MPTDVVAAPDCGARSTDPLVLTEEEHDTVAWILSVGFELAHGATEDAADELRRSMLSMHAAWVGPIFHAPRYSADGHVTVERPADEYRRALARLLRLLGAAARPSAHPTGMVFYIPARDADTLADRIEGAVS